LSRLPLPLFMVLQPLFFPSRQLSPRVCGGLDPLLVFAAGFPEYVVPPRNTSWGPFTCGSSLSNFRGIRVLTMLSNPYLDIEIFLTTFCLVFPPPLASRLAPRTSEKSLLTFPPSPPYIRCGLALFFTLTRFSPPICFRGRDYVLILTWFLLSSLSLATY